jgi:formylglycine-generating enzyme required for sulfatase activity
VTAGDPVTFTVVATGTAPLSYQWYLNNVAISGATADYYSIPSAQSANAGNYTVTVSNGTLPNATSTAVALTVNPVVVAPTISTYPVSQSVVAGNSASFSVVATGSAPLSYQWHLDNVNDGSNSASYQSPSTTAIGSHTMTVTVSNAAGSVLSNPALLTVTAMPVAPSITTQPSAQVVTVGNPVTFTVAAGGTAPLSYQWYSGTSSTTVTTPISGANSDFYAPSTALAGTIYFAVAVSNGIGTPATSNSVALTVNAAPVAPTIAINGSSTPNVTEGQSITFTATATGSTPYTYLWQQNGTSVGSNASTFTLALPRLADSGSSITVTVTNAAGSVTSSAVTLTVNPLLVNLGSSMPLNLTPIPAGTFTMGSPSSDPDYHPDETQHQVTVSQNFYMGTYLVTQAQWTQVMGANPSYFQTPANLQRPVEEVSYTDITTAATGFLAKLNQNAIVSPGIPSGYVFRLPTEAEWEYACRAGTTTRFYWGDYSDANTTINSYAWYYGNDGATTEPVGGLLPNDWGLYDMAGNLQEWCQDWYGAYDSGPDTDPAGQTSGSYRVYRGGSWSGISLGCRSALRGFDYPDSHANGTVGFRVVLAPPRTP